MIGLHEQRTTAAPVSVVIADVDFRHSADIERLRSLLAQPHAVAAPIVALLRDNSHLIRVQAIAVGATFLVPADVSVADIFARACANYSIGDPWAHSSYRLGTST
jgi:DNA-binding NarL/FixJ family response regulator